MGVIHSVIPVVDPKLMFLLIRLDLSAITRRVVGCAVRTIGVIGAHGAPYISWINLAAPI